MLLYFNHFDVVVEPLNVSSIQWYYWTISKVLLKGIFTSKSGTCVPILPTLVSSFMITKIKKSSFNHAIRNPHFISISIFNQFPLPPLLICPLPLPDMSINIFYLNPVSVGGGGQYQRGPPSYRTFHFLITTDTGLTLKSQHRRRPSL